MGKNQFVYTGCENLEAMAEAKNYNKYLIGIITSNAPQTKKLKVLDFGAGSGTYADLLKEKAGIHVDCLEPDKKLQKTLSTKGYKVYSGIASLKPKTYDIIYALNVLEHIQEDGSVVTQLKEALKPGGKLIIYVPAFQLLYSSMDKKVEHVRRYRKNRLRSFADTAGLKINSLHYCDPLGFGAALTYKIIGRKDGVISPSSVKAYDKTVFPASKLFEPITKHFFGKNVVLVAEREE